MIPDFQEFPKIPRWSRPIIITEKIDGTNGVIYVQEDGPIWVGSRTRWITPGKGTDNHNFASWAFEHETELRQLGPGMHHGEWWGSGINRGYGLPMGEKRFSLLNSTKWRDDKPAILGPPRPACCHVVPILYEGPMSERAIEDALDRLRTEGSVASPGFKDPEGIVIYHVQGSLFFKKTLKNDDMPKSLIGRREANE